jgi:hypothetical protein
VEVAVDEVAVKDSANTAPPTESFAYGVDDPMPKRLLVLSKNNAFASPEKPLDPFEN